MAPRAFAPAALRRVANTAVAPRLFGFFLGSTLTGAGVYYYVLEEYRVANELLTEDIYSLQAAVQRVHAYDETLEEKLDNAERRK
ncbi:hypothetical protein VE04_09927 [Pseudogymnoascus sp. 24MN13]|nr:hypothetical protein VE04_09927 [Pseudogymnoascus sp. 24MN13]